MMKYSGAYLVRFALEQIGIKFTFGIPGIHNTELYDELDLSEKITPVLVTHEMGGAFMAEALSRTSDSMGAMVIVPGAGTTHAMSGIGEAFLDGIPLLIICGGIRRDIDKSYQLHQLEQRTLVQSLTKGYFLVEDHDQVVETIYKAYDLARSGTPGPVFVEIPSNILLFDTKIENLPSYQKKNLNPQILNEVIYAAVEMLLLAKKPALYVGWGASECTAELIELAEMLQMPVATTMQGVSVFPFSHPLHVGMGFGKSGTPAAQAAFEGVDCLFAIGARFGEVATGSYGLPIPTQLIHLDINEEVFDKNYKAQIKIHADSKEALVALLLEFRNMNYSPKFKVGCEMARIIKIKKENYFKEWEDHDSQDRVNPYLFFKALRKAIEQDAFVLLDDGNHTFLAAELFPSFQSKHLISPTDFNAMGYCVPATIGTKLANPKTQVVGVVGDGGFLMTGLELLTATTLNLGIVIFVFHDGELGQIGQFQKSALNKKTCSILGEIKIEGIAIATGAHFLEIKSNDQIEKNILEALNLSSKGRPVLVDVKIDYSKKTQFTKGVVATNFSHFPLGQKFRFVGRAIKRHLF